jgi:hypothetical protein
MLSWPAGVRVIFAICLALWGLILIWVGVTGLWQNL